MSIVSTPIMLDKERHLRFTLNSIIDLSKKFNIDLDKWAGADGEKTIAEQVETLRAVLWAGLVHEDETLTVEAVGKMIDIGMLASLIADTQKAVAGATDPGDPEKK